jgi:hypothetical protein|mmetsp:Transcript_65886/g.104364  ORF Transcript_65886/g.104364 Transcript_65886/m.104364 type:complete len:238 (-) Transcript_65886:35-748(-)|eukprot:CAMPEP_0169239590 /NCGR_PEP_ID=MMETSP1016-20121227/30993_1 /TAXON_ID=342587 /ORGANISM="Karlodinium micrum, Strain CCMP2283" /LENGTH=237 /DNA_ID=CAMNT_0009319535 /DNA_START=51 /DNA_END=764 /DNA_ORIENTATION=+
MLVLPVAASINKSFFENQSYGFETNSANDCGFEGAYSERKQSTLESKTAIIFDWDDTLLCTSYLSKLQDGQIPQETEAYLQSIEQSAYALLEMAVELGHTFIITNATEGWVEDSAACSMPSLLPLLERVRIISARSMQEELYPGDMREWKVQTFLDLGRQLHPGTIANLISIGDSSFELDAAHELGAFFGCKFIKTVKLRERPSPMVHATELNLLVSKFSTIVKKRSNLTVKLENKS